MRCASRVNNPADQYCGPRFFLINTVWCWPSGTKINPCSNVRRHVVCSLSKVSRSIWWHALSDTHGIKASVSSTASANSAGCKQDTPDRTIQEQLSFTFDQYSMLHACDICCIMYHPHPFQPLVLTHQSPGPHPQLQSVPAFKFPFLLQLIWSLRQWSCWLGSRSCTCVQQTEHTCQCYGCTSIQYDFHTCQCYFRYTYACSTLKCLASYNLNIDRRRVEWVGGCVGGSGIFGSKAVIGRFFSLREEEREEWGSR